METFILVIDCDESNLLLFNSLFETEGYEVDTTNKGYDAFELLCKDPYKYDVVILDHEIEDIDARELLKRIKAYPILNKIPIIYQMKCPIKPDIYKSLNSGVYYFVSKPFDSEGALTALVKRAVLYYNRWRRQKNEFYFTLDDTMKLIHNGSFYFRTPKEAENLAKCLSRMCPDPDRAGNGLLELLLNAIEHGNLGIGYNEKSRLLNLDRFEIELEHRLNLPENKPKNGIIEIEKRDDEIHFVIQDRGKGFSWERYLTIDPKRAFDPNGRGIAIAKARSFDSMQYLDCGNKVMVKIRL